MLMSNIDYSDCKRLTLPTGHVGMYFAGQPPQINGIKEQSALAGMVMLGDEAEYIVGLVVPGIIEMYGFDQSELSYLLGRYSDVEGRVLLVSKNPVVDGGKKAMVTLPRGKIGVIFAGSPPIVTMVRDESPLNGLIASGQIVLGLQIPNTLDFASSDIDTSELVAMLKANQHRDDRILVVSDEQIPIIQTPSSVAKKDVVMPPSDFAEPGGDWYLQQYCGGKSIAAACCGLLLCGLIGVGIICMNLDERYIYLEPNNGRRFNTKGKIVGKGAKGLIPLPEGFVIPMKSPKKGKELPVHVNASAVHPVEE